MSQYPGAGYGQPARSTGDPASAGPAKTSPRLGAVGLVLVGIGLVVAIAALFLSPIIVVNHVSSTSNSMDQLGASILTELGIPILMMVSGLVGLAGWIVGIVATVTNRGRAFGVAAIITGVVSFLIGSMSMFGVLFVVSG